MLMTHIYDGSQQIWAYQLGLAQRGLDGTVQSGFELCIQNFSSLLTERGYNKK